MPENMSSHALRTGRPCCSTTGLSADDPAEGTCVWAEWVPTLRAVGSYGAQVFIRLRLNVWTTGGRLHASEGVAMCVGSVARSSRTTSDTKSDASELGFPLSTF